MLEGNGVWPIEIEFALIVTLAGLGLTACGGNGDATGTASTAAARNSSIVLNAFFIVFFR